MPPGCFQQIPSWLEKNPTSSHLDAIPLPSGLLSQKKPRTQQQKQIFSPPLSSKVAAAQKRGEKGKTVQKHNRSHIMEQG